MNQSNSIPTKQINSAVLVKHLLIGAGIGLTLILIFLLGTGEPDPNWPKLWMLKPLLIVPIAGGMGGLILYFLTHHMIPNKNLAIILGLIGYVIVLWMGFILGLDGTMWD
ncbi:MAG TPA: hypothetical protein VK921_01245 [Anditalea sp.]|nr:hypothetical protein [Anditalea sp.]